MKPADAPYYTPLAQGVLTLKRLLCIFLCLGVLSTITGCYAGKRYGDSDGWNTRNTADEWRLNHPQTPITPRS